MTIDLHILLSITQMKTHHRLIISVVAISIAIFLISSGIFEPEELFMAFDIPRSAGKYMAFAGMGLAGVGNTINFMYLGIY